MSALKNKKFQSAGCLCLLFVLLFFCTALPVSANETVVRVGYYPMVGYQESAEDGTRSGFGYDYYMQIQKYTHWKYEFVEASYADCMKMLLTGEIDVMSGVLKTSAREEQMLFSRYSISNSQNKLYALSDADDIFYESYDAFDGCKVAALRGTLTNELDEYCALHGFSLQMSEYDTPAQMLKALQDGQVDMIYTSSMSSGGETKIVAHMDKNPLYYAVALQRPELAEALDNGLRKIIDNNPNFYTQMSEKYMVKGSNATATLTREEAAYLDSSRTAYVVLDPDWAPISWRDSATGEYQGIFANVMESIREYSGLSYQFCTREEFDALAAQDPTILDDEVTIFADDNAWAVQNNVMVGNHVLDASVVCVSRRSATRDGERALRVALPKGYYITWLLRNDLDAANVIYYDTIEECLNAVRANKADETFVNELVGTYYLSMAEYSSLFAAANTGYSENLAFAVNRDSESPLLSILDKSLLGVGSTELDQAILQNSIAPPSIGLRSLYYSNPVLMLGVTSLIILLAGGVVLILCLVRAKRRRMAHELEKEVETGNARTEFFMMISHEVRTPLNAVSGYLALAAEQCAPSGPETEYIHRAQGAAAQLSAISEDMLDYTRISSGSAALAEDVFDLKEVIRNVEQNISLQAEKKGVRFGFSVHDLECEYVIGDALRVSQMMQNLLSNAVKFTDRGGRATGSVSQRMTDEQNLELTFAAWDTGRGMSAEFLKTVCAPFGQGDKAYSRTHGGLGLGLYLTKYYLDAMHGTMEVTSALGKGSCFTLHIPLKKAPGNQIAGQKPELSHVRVMIGGPEEGENHQLKETLKRLSIRSDCQTTSAMVKRRVISRSNSEYAYSLVLLDESMMGEDYLLVRELAALPNPPVVFVLTENTKRLSQLAGVPQVARVLYKPIFQSALFNAILEVFGECPTEESAIAPEDFHGLNSMIVEDNAVNADILQRILTRAGVRSTRFENGRQALNAFAASEPEEYKIIFMDIQMPEMNGYEATAAIRALKRDDATTVPILAVSANAFPEDVQNSLKVGMNEHLSKPIGIRQLYAAIRKYYPEA